MDETVSIKGLWEGHFEYFSSPDTGSHPFKAKIFDKDGEISGLVIEEHSLSFEQVRSQISGKREGRSVTFTKQYLEADEMHKAIIEYAGEVSQDGSQITGTWKLPHDGGPFTMTREI